MILLLKWNEIIGLVENQIYWWGNINSCPQKKPFFYWFGMAFLKTVIGKPGYRYPPSLSSWWERGRDNVMAIIKTIGGMPHRKLRHYGCLSSSLSQSWGLAHNCVRLHIHHPVMPSRLFAAGTYTPLNHYVILSVSLSTSHEHTSTFKSGTFPGVAPSYDTICAIIPASYVSSFGPPGPGSLPEWTEKGFDMISAPCHTQIVTWPVVGVLADFTGWISFPASLSYHRAAIYRLTVTLILFR